ncbi:TROVE domain-containing protein [Bradyrhizobium sp. C9]|uniref:TROVE domain-containing protein n=1 Tax=Bradyrhizobium sp. C9 TaxID=142585 RepID=UPI000BE9BB24|nr:TROVE domain-containing protein [Bradyrhizobium sp. C9]PDT77144.1 RNA-binding protein [Bradyrhizobium sp. C9]
MKYADIVSKPVPQIEALNERQVQNNAGGFVFAIDDWARLDRFLILGSDAPTYYQTAPALTRENAKVVDRCFAADAARTVARTVEISDEGRAPKNDPAIFVLAIGAAHPDQAVRKLALAAVPRVCRTATHLFQFVKAARALGRGWGRSLKTAIANWYNSKSLDDVAYQAIKYRERESYSHKRLLQTAHPAALESPARIALYRWMRGLDPHGDLPTIVQAHLKAMSSGTSKKDLLDLIAAARLPWEAIPSEYNADPDAWRAMLPTLGLGALVRNLGNMTRLGTIAPLSLAEALVVERLGDEGAIRKSRLHPFSILLAMAVYSSDRSVRGSGSWVPSRAVIDALDGAFYKAFANVKASGKRVLIALDVSGSMTAPIMGSPISCRDATAALALVTMATERQTHVVGFTSAGHSQRHFGGRWGGGEAGLTPLAISPRQRLTDAVRAVSNLPFGGTDCALPMLYALEKGLEVDAFFVYTDNETWAGGVHPVQALKQYRQKTGIPAKLVVVGMTSTGFSIADQSDAGMLDVVGFDAGAPAVMADFIR